MKSCGTSWTWRPAGDEEGENPTSCGFHRWRGNRPATPVGVCQSIPECLCRKRVNAASVLGQEDCWWDPSSDLLTYPQETSVTPCHRQTWPLEPSDNFCNTFQGDFSNSSRISGLRGHLQPDMPARCCSTAEGRVGRSEVGIRSAEWTQSVDNAPSLSRAWGIQTLGVSHLQAADSRFRSAKGPPQHPGAPRRRLPPVKSIEGLAFLTKHPDLPGHGASMIEAI